MPKMQKHRIVAASAALGLVAGGVACGTTQTSQPSDHPVRGSATGGSTLTFSSSSPGHATGSVQNQGPLSPLGSNVKTYVDITSIQFAPDGSFSGTTNVTFVTPTGDKVFARTTGTGWSSGPSATTRGDTAITITGGTGRYAHASGTLTSHNEGTTGPLVGNTVTSQEHYSTVGTIRY